MSMIKANVVSEQCTPCSRHGCNNRAQTVVDGAAVCNECASITPQTKSAGELGADPQVISRHKRA